MHRIVTAALMLLAACAWPLAGWADVPLLRISTENTADHVQTRAIARFAEVLAQRTSGRLEVRHYHSAELFRDRDVVKALQLGKVEMAVPGTWQLDRFAPDIGVFLLPMFYGRDIAATDALRDGEIGKIINQRLEGALEVKVLGRWIDLGFAHVYGIHRRIRSHADLTGMTVRVAGGEANLQRLEALGAQARTVAWPDLPAALARSTIDGILSTHETIASAELWRYGVTSAFEDRQYFPQYIPLISRRLWDSLDEDVRRILAATWEEQVTSARSLAAAAQEEARRDLQAHGVTMTTPGPTDLAAARQRLLARQDALVETLGIDRDLVRRIAQQLPP